MAHHLLCRDGTRWSVALGAHGDLLVTLPDEPLLKASDLARYARPKLPGMVSTTLFAPSIMAHRGWLAAHRGLDREFSSQEGIALLKEAGDRELEALRAEPDQSPPEDPDSPPYRPPEGGPAGPRPRHPPGTYISADCVTSRLIRRSG